MISEHSSPEAPDPLSTTEILDDLRQLRGMRFGRRELSPVDDDRLNTYEAKHGRYIGDAFEQAQEVVEKPKSGMQTTELQPGKATYFSFDEKGIQFPLDLQKIGLPELTADYIPLAVVATKDSLKVVAADRNAPEARIKPFYLQNNTALTDPQTHEPAQWLQPGQADFTTRNNTTESTRVNEQTGKGVHAITVNPDADGAVHIIRATATKTETAMASTIPEKPTRTGNKFALRKVIGGFLLGSTLTGGMLAPYDAYDHDAPITTAAEMVQPSGTEKVGDVTQAERDFDEDTLSRSRVAFDAWFKGDEQKLKQMVEANKDFGGYRTDWITRQEMQKVKDAKNNAELESAFNTATQGLGVTLEVADTPDKTITSPDDTQTVATDLEGSKKVAEGALQVLETMDPNVISKAVGPLQFKIVGHINPLKSNPDFKPGAYFYSSGETNQLPAIIMPTDGSSNVIYTLPHELTHDVDSHLDFDQVVGDLNPPGEQYVGQKDYVNSPTKVGSNQVVGEDYSNVSIEEDVAVTGQDVMGINPTLNPVDSTYNEKVSAEIFSMEQLQPGFTAAFLLRAKPYAPSADQLSISAAEFATDYGFAVQGISLGIVLAIGGVMAARAARRRRRAKQAALAV